MGNVVLSMSVSVDGFFEGPGSDLSWHRIDEELHGHFNEELRGAAAFLEGRVTWELMAGFWPDADRDPANPVPIVEFAGIWRDMPKIVYSRTLDEVGWNATLAREVVPEEVRELAGRSDGDLVVGGALLAAEFARQDLFDEYRLYVHPVVVGEGRRLLPLTPGSTALRLVDTRVFGNGVVRLQYARP